LGRHRRRRLSARALASEDGALKWQEIEILQLLARCRKTICV
jgi:hypothetical protein